MTGDCDTCNHSVNAQCGQGNEGRSFLCSDNPLPCPVWEVRGKKWELERQASLKRAPWPFPIGGDLHETEDDRKEVTA